MKEVEETLGALTEFKEWSKTQFNEIRIDHREILTKIDEINQQRWLLYGKLTILNGLVIAVIEALAHKSM